MTEFTKQVAANLAKIRSDKGSATGENPQPGQTPLPTGENPIPGNAPAAGGENPTLSGQQPVPGGENLQNQDPAALADPLGEGEDGHDVTISSLTDLAGHLGIEPEQIYGLKIKLNGSGDEISISDLKDRIQDATNQSNELKQARGRLLELEQERNTVLSQMGQLRNQAMQLDEEGQSSWSEMKAIEFEYQRINWDKLEEMDPGRAALEKQKLLQRHAEAKGKVEQAMGRFNVVRQQQAMQAKQYHDTELLKRVPDWADPEKAQKDLTAIISWAQRGYGFTDQELSQAIDWRQRDVLRKAYLYDEIQKELGALQAEPPKQIKGGITLRSSSKKATEVKNLVDKAKTSGNRRDKVTAAKALLDQAFTAGA